MKNTVIAIFVGFVLIAVILAVSFSKRREHDPKDLSYWLRAGAAKDWTSEAAHGEPQAQFHLGLTLIRTNLVTMIDRIPRVSAIPLIGKRLFETITYGIDSNISQEQLADAYRWIKKSADQGFAPAKEAEKLFIGKIGKPNQSGEAKAARRSAQRQIERPRRLAPVADLCVSSLDAHSQNQNHFLFGRWVVRSCGHLDTNILSGTHARSRLGWLSSSEARRKSRGAAGYD